jgi:hypothetical protein
VATKGKCTSDRHIEQAKPYQASTEAVGKKRKWQARWLAIFIDIFYGAG